MKQNYFAFVAIFTLAVFPLLGFTLQVQAAPTNLDSIQTLEELGTWLEANPPAVIPLSESEGQKYLAESTVALRTSVNKLNVYFNENGVIGQKWAKSLQMNELNQTLGQPVPDLEVLTKIDNNFHSHQWGLEILELKTVTKALDDYIILRMIIEQNTDPSEGLKEATSRLIAVLKSPDKVSFTCTHELNFVLNWLKQYRQAPEVCKAVERLAGNINVYAHLSDKLVLKFLDAPIDQTSTVNDYIAGTQQVGTVRTTGRTSGLFNPDPNRINLSIMLNAKIGGTTTTQSRNVVVSSASNHKIFVVKDIFFDGSQFSTTPARSTAKMNSQITGINAPGGLVQSIATNRAYEMKPQADAEAEYLTRVRAEDAVNSTVAKLLNNTNERLNHAAELYRARGLYPKPFLCATTKNQLIFQGLIKDSQPLISKPHPVAPAEADIFVSIHQSILTESAKAMLSDLKADKRVFLSIAQSMMSEEKFKDFYAKMQNDEAKRKQENQPMPSGYIYFNKNYPVDVEFNNNTMKLIVRLDGFQGQDSPSVQEIPMNLIIEYKITNIDANGIHLNRVNEVEFVPRDFETGEVRKLTASETTIRNRLLSSLKQTFPDEYVLKNGILNNMIRTDSPLKSTMTGTIKPIMAEAKDGWLSLAWQIVQ